MKVKVKTTGEIIDVHFSHNYNTGGSNEKVYSDSFSGKYYYASELEQLTDNTIDKACEIYRKHIIKFNPTLKEFPTALDEAVSVFRKQLEE